MPFELHTGSDIASEVRRMAAEQAERAVGYLTDGLAHPEDQVDLHGEDAWDEAVHEVRKRCKKVRAIARVVRDPLGEHYTAINHAFRDTARLLAEQRDAWTIVETLDALAAADLDVLPAADVAVVREHLVARYLVVRRQAQQDEQLQQAGDALTDAAGGIAGWPLPGDMAPDDLRPGLLKVRRRGEARWDELRDRLGDDPDSSTEVAHQMRKRVKYLRYQLEVLEQAWPPVLQAQSEALDELGSLLGDDHDLAVLAEVVLDEDAGGPALATKLAAAASLRRHELRRDIAPLAARLYAEPAEPFADRIITYLDQQLSAAQR